MEEGKQVSGRRDRKPRRLKVNVVYGKARFAECMEHVIRADNKFR